MDEGEKEIGDQIEGKSISEDLIGVNPVESPNTPELDPAWKEDM